MYVCVWCYCTSVLLVFRCFPLIVAVFPSVLLCNLDLFSLNRFMTFEQRYTVVGDVPLIPPYGVYICQLVRHARLCSDVIDFNERSQCITGKLLSRGFRYHIKLDLISKCGCTCRKLIKNGISHPELRWLCTKRPDITVIRVNSSNL